MLLLHGGGCLENSSIASATLNEMVLQSYDGTIQIFPDWDNDIDCSFENLRADGAFLISASMRAGKVVSIKIESEKGRPIKIFNPFECASVKIGNEEIILHERVIELNLTKGTTAQIQEK